MINVLARIRTQGGHACRTTAKVAHSAHPAKLSGNFFTPAPHFFPFPAQAKPRADTPPPPHTRMRRSACRRMRGAGAGCPRRRAEGYKPSEYSGVPIGTLVTRRPVRGSQGPPVTRVEQLRRSAPARPPPAGTHPACTPHHTRQGRRTTQVATPPARQSGKAPAEDASPGGRVAKPPQRMRRPEAEWRSHSTRVAEGL